MEGTMEVFTWEIEDALFELKEEYDADPGSFDTYDKFTPRAYAQDVVADLIKRILKQRGNLC